MCEEDVPLPHGGRTHSHLYSPQELRYLVCAARWSVCRHSYSEDERSQT